MSAMTPYIIDILMSVVTTIALWFLRKLGKQIDEYQAIIEKSRNEDLKDVVAEIVNEKIAPMQASIDKQSKAMEDFEIAWEKKQSQDLLFYKYQLINACKKCLKQGYLTQYQFDNLSEIHKIYSGLGGNFQGDEYYERAKALPIRSQVDQYYKNNDVDDDDDVYVGSDDIYPMFHPDEKDPKVDKKK